METLYSLQELFTSEAFRTYIFSGDWSLIQALLVLMFIDIITGLLKAWKNKNLWSRKSLYGFARKLLIFTIITVANIIDFIMQLNGVLVLATVMFYIMNEVLSITENAGQLGLPLPKKLMEVLEVVQKQDGFQDINKVEVEIKDKTSDSTEIETRKDVPKGHNDNIK